jgi:signal transduction histidine kinase
MLLHRSLAVRLATFYALLFSLGGAAVFAALYYLLADALEGRERRAVEKWAEDYAAIYEKGGPAALRARLNAAETSPEVSSLFVRIIGTDGEATFARVPPDWIERQAERIPLPEAFGANAQVERVVQSIRIPRNAEKDFTVAFRPLYDGRTLQVARSTDNRAVLLAPLRRSFLIVGSIATALSALGGGLLAWRFTRPLRQVSETARRIIETGDLAARVPEPSVGGELRDLVRHLNSVLGKNASLIRAQREALDNLAHDLRTPLTRLRGTAELALQSPADTPAAREALADCVEESERIQRLLETMLDVSAAENGTLPLRLEPLDLQLLLQDAADLYREVAEEKKISVTLEPGKPIPVQADPLRLGQALANLLDNALKYTPEGGKVFLAARLTLQGSEIEVCDSGPGVPEAEREKIWRRLYRSDASRSQRGLGLGLSLVKAIAEAHKGSVHVDAAPLGGARFTLRLP